MKKIVFIVLFIFLISSVFAYPSPEGFNGNIIVNGGGSAEGKTLKGFLDGELAGSCVIQNNKFDIVITDEIGDGGTIEFYIGDKKTDAIFIFSKFDVITTDLTFTIPGDSSSPSSDSPEGGSSSPSKSSKNSPGGSSSVVAQPASSQADKENDTINVSSANVPLGTGLSISGLFNSGTGIFVVIGGVSILILGIVIVILRKKKAVKISENIKEDDVSENKEKENN